MENSGQLFTLYQRPETFYSTAHIFCAQNLEQFLDIMDYLLLQKSPFFENFLFFLD
jgi:hypothetical protein